MDTWKYNNVQLIHANKKEKKFDSHCARKWKLNPIMVFRGVDFSK